jgi:hypothetical protein
VLTMILLLLSGGLLFAGAIILLFEINAFRERRRQSLRP